MNLTTFFLGFAAGFYLLSAHAEYKGRDEKQKILLLDARFFVLLAIFYKI